jgi:hypothetical protein
MTDAKLWPLVAALSEPALFDEGVEAARNACVAGASIAAAAITAAAWYDNPLTGLGALHGCMDILAGLPPSLAAWRDAFALREHGLVGDAAAPGFGFVTPALASAIAATAHRLFTEAGAGDAWRGRFFVDHRDAITEVAGPLNAAGLAALGFVDHAIDRETAERAFLCARISTAIAEAQGARARGLAEFPFFEDAYHYAGTRPPPRAFDIAALRKQVGLD